MPQPIYNIPELFRVIFSSYLLNLSARWSYFDYVILCLDGRDKQSERFSYITAFFVVQKSPCVV